MWRLVALVVVVAFAAPELAHAQETVHRCIGEHGEISFSSTPCGNAAAEPASSTTAKSIGEHPGGVASTCPASPHALRDLVASAFSRRDPNLLAGAMRWDGVSGGAARSRMRELTELTQQPLLGIDLDANDAAEDADDDADDERGYARRGYDEDRGHDDERAYDRDEDGRDDDRLDARRARDDASFDDVMIVRTGALAGGSGEHAFRMTPSRGCYWLDW